MNRLRALREDKDLRQIDVSNATGIDQKTLSNYETGKTLPNSDALILLADFFNVSIDYLLGRSTHDYVQPQNVIRQIEKIQKDLNNVKKDINQILGL